jgi:hypothetical protein
VCTILNESGWKPEVIELQLAHQARNKVLAAYNRVTYLPERRTMMQQGADVLEAYAAGDGKILPGRFGPAG